MVEEQPCRCMKDLNSMKDPNFMENLNSIKEALVWGDAFLFSLMGFGGYPGAGR